MAEKAIPVGRLAGLEISVLPQFWGGTALITALVGGGMMWFADASAPSALRLGVLGAMLYWTAELLHHFGHAIAAQRTGYPMIGVRMGVFLILASSLYPKDEGDLPAATHIRRALGGPITSAVIGILFILAGLVTPGGFGQWVLGFGLLNLFWFGLGALIPIMGMTDGSTILYWRKRL